MKRLGILFVIGYLLSGGVADAATYYVSKAGNDSYSCAQAQSLSNAKLTLNNAVGCLKSGDTLSIKAGVYAEALINNLPSGTSWTDKVRIAAVAGETVWMRPNGTNYVVNLNLTQQYIEFDGVNMDGTNVPYSTIFIEAFAAGRNAHHIRFMNAEVIGSGLQTILLSAQGSGFIGSNEFIGLNVHGGGLTSDAAHNNSPDFDHSFYIGSPNNLVENCDIYDSPGGAMHIYNGSGGSPDGNIIRNNKIHDGHKTFGGQRHWGVIIASGNGNMVYNNLVYGIPTDGASSVGIFAYGGSNTAIYNNTVYGNSGEGIVVEVGVGGSVVKNNISYANGAGNYRNSGSATVASSNLFDVNPMFVSANTGNFQLASTSPAIDAAETISMVSTDVAGTRRPQGQSYDMGAYENSMMLVQAPAAPTLLRIVQN